MKNKTLPSAVFGRYIARRIFRNKLRLERDKPIIESTVIQYRSCLVRNVTARDELKHISIAFGIHFVAGFGRFAKFDKQGMRRDASLSHKT